MTPAERDAMTRRLQAFRETLLDKGAARIEPNRADGEFFIRKAIGWALRAYAWVEPQAVVAYCDAHELSPLSRREALKNVTT
jgi:3-methyladenine DNA glycosylase AlkD